MSKSFDLKSKVALITGGARGIGAAVARRYCELGAKVAICSRSQSECDQQIHVLRQSGFSAIGMAADLADPAQVGTLFDRVEDQLGALDILVHCAAIQGPIGPIWENPAADWVAAIQVNLNGTFYCLQEASRRMVARSRSGHLARGKILLFSGGGATGPRPNFTSYAAAKAAVVRLAETSAEELKPFGIDCNSIAPGAAPTRMLEQVMQAGAQASGTREYEIASRQFADRNSSGSTDFSAVQNLTAFLGSSESDGISGRLISAQWDPWQDPAFADRLRKPSSLGTLRRVDDQKIIDKS